MQNFRNVKAWQKAHELVLLIYELTADFPKEELFGLRTQLRRTAVDIAGYVAEGSGKPNDEEFAKCVGTALGFANRIEYFVLVALDLRLISDEKHVMLNARIVEVSKILGGLWKTLRENGRNSIDNYRSAS